MRKLLLLTSVFITLFAATPYANNTFPPAGNTEDVSCSLPAPENLTITNITPTSVIATWSPVAGAAGYFVEVVDQLNNASVYTNTVFMTTDTVTGLLPGHPYEFYVSSLCPNGEAGKPTMVEFGTDIIVDLVLTNFQGKCPDIIYKSDFYHPKTLDVPLEADLTYEVEVGQKDNAGILYRSKFWLSYTITANGTGKGYFAPAAGPAPFLGFLHANVDVIGGEGASSVSLNNLNNPEEQYLEFSLPANWNLYPNIGSLHIQTQSKGKNQEGLYHITIKRCNARLGAISGGKSGGERSEETQHVDAPAMLLHPNPFKNQLRLDITYGNKYNSDDQEIMITDAQGSLAFSNTFTSNDIAQGLAIDSENWRPGMYLVYWKSGDKITVSKAIKIE